MTESKKATGVFSFLKRNGAWIGLIALAVVLEILTRSMTDGTILSSRNLTNLLKQTAINGVLASGMTLVILTSGIDLSIGSIVAFAGVVAGLSQVSWGLADQGSFGAVQTLAIAIAAGGVAGFINGGLIASLGIPPFIITLGMMVIARGVALIVTDGGGISPMGEEFKNLSEGFLDSVPTVILSVMVIGLALFQYRKTLIDAVFPLVTFVGLSVAFFQYKGFPHSVLFLVATLVLTSLLLKYTALGRCIYAIGSNEQASFWAGVPVRKVKWIVYTLLGLYSGLGGALLTSRLNSAVPTAGDLFELDAIAAVVIGGTSLKGGTGTVMGSFVGALTIALLNNGMDLLNVPSFYQKVFKGIIIILAVALDKNQRQSAT